MEKLYTATVTATGGRNGHIRSGYAACFDSALHRVIRDEKVTTGTTSVTARVSLGKLDAYRYGLAVELDISIPQVEQSVAENLANRAHEICPYSNATRGNVEVTITVHGSPAP